MVWRWWYKIYIFVVVLVGTIAVLPVFIHHSEEPSSIKSSIESLGFYGASVPYESRAYIGSKLATIGATNLTTSNITVRAGTFDDKTYRVDTQVYRNVSFIMDSKKPSVSYKVSVNLDPLGKVDPSTSISCPESSDQQGNDSICQEMVK